MVLERKLIMENEEEFIKFLVRNTFYGIIKSESDIPDEVKEYIKKKGEKTNGKRDVDGGI